MILCPAPRTRFRPAASLRFHPPKLSRHPRSKYRQTEWFRDVVIRTGLQPCHDIRFHVVCRQHYDGYVIFFFISCKKSNPFPSGRFTSSTTRSKTLPSSASSALRRVWLTYRFRCLVSQSAAQTARKGYVILHNQYTMLFSAIRSHLCPPYHSSSRIFIPISSQILFIIILIRLPSHRNDDKYRLAPAIHREFPPLRCPPPSIPECGRSCGCLTACGQW